MTAKRVFLLSDYFTVRKDFWVVADTKQSALAKTVKGIRPGDREEGGQEFESTEFQEEIETVQLIRNVSDQFRLVSIICTNETPDAYYGYEVREVDEAVEIEERRYPKSEWQVNDGSARPFA